MSKILVLILLFIVVSCSEAKAPENSDCKIGETQECYTGADGTAGVGECKKGTQACNTNGEWGACENEVTPEAEICDGKDNDCNDSIDDALNAPVADKTAGICANQRKVCDGSNGWQEPDYSKVPNYEEIETKCDNIDNDCDGMIDNNLIPPNSDNQNGLCKDSKKVCKGVNGWENPDYTTAVVGYEATETTCDGIDSDCDGVVDNGFENHDDDTEADCVDPDDDNDGVLDFGEDGVTPLDNCQFIENADQADVDGDGMGDACDDDIDGDGKLNNEDNCIYTANADQADADSDGVGDACDGDQDGDTIADDVDNCISVPNLDQANHDDDTMGDACDTDDDNDGINDDVDNCQFVKNGAVEGDSQLDTDNDGHGNACDACDDDPNKYEEGVCGCGVADIDTDGDAVLDCNDNCIFVQNADQINADGDDYGAACDCDDSDNSKYCPEVCDGVDNNNNGIIDEGACSDSCELKQHDGKAYLFCKDSSTWLDAKLKCNTIGYSLVQIKNQNERDWVKSVIENATDRYFIALNDIQSEGNFKWADESDSYTGFIEWNTGEPNNSNDDEDCATIYPSGKYNDDNCSSEKYYICESNTLDIKSSCKKILDAGKSYGSINYLIDVDGTGDLEPIVVYCDMETDGGGYTFYPVKNGIETHKSDINNSCKELGMNIVVPRTKEHFLAMYNKYRVGGTDGNTVDYFKVVPGITKNFDGDSRDEYVRQIGYSDISFPYHYNKCAMNSASLDKEDSNNSTGLSVCAKDWGDFNHRADSCNNKVDNDGEPCGAGKWWISDVPYSEPSGDYTFYSWLEFRGLDSNNNIRFNDKEGENNVLRITNYICSTNDKE